MLIHAPSPAFPQLPTLFLHSFPWPLRRGLISPSPAAAARRDTESMEKPRSLQARLSKAFTETAPGIPRTAPPGTSTLPDPGAPIQQIWSVMGSQSRPLAFPKLLCPVRATSIQQIRAQRVREEILKLGQTSQDFHSMWHLAGCCRGSASHGLYPNIGTSFPGCTSRNHHLPSTQLHFRARAHAGN